MVAVVTGRQEKTDRPVSSVIHAMPCHASLILHIGGDAADHHELRGVFGGARLLRGAVVCCLMSVCDLGRG